MSKGHEIKQSKVIQFPGLEKRLLERGLENLQSQNYHEAIDLFQQSIELDSENHDSYIGLLLAYFDSGRVEQAVDLAHHMLQEGIGDEMETLDIYLMLLVQKSQHEQVVEEINLLLKESRIPYHKQEHFERLLHLSEKMIENKTEVEKIDFEDESPLGSLDLYQYHDPQEQVLIASQLSHQPIKRYEEEIKQYLKSYEGDPFLKTLILNVLKEQNYDHPVDIEKFGKLITIVPDRMVHLTENERVTELLVVISDVLEDEDPILYDNIKTLIERHFFLIYPFVLEELSIQAWGAAFHYIGNEYYGSRQSIDKVIDTYDADDREVEKALEFIKRVEKYL
ncbi:tetratricopeptide repeat protein [Niallia sp. XMNu-256]|uniref:tetratricopeptide repeat protein n=1 Tax=Niallia sp. XMNu-256 TaxID=3082444 RepID=UPI0030CB5A10